MNEPQPIPQPYYPLPVRRRPLGITILAVLEALLGIFLLLASLGSFIVAALWNNHLVHEALQNSTLPQWISNDPALFFAIVGVASLAIAVLAFVLAYGFLQGRRWAWTLGIAVGIISIVWSLISTFISGFNISQIPSLVISVGIEVVIIVYLFQPGVKAWFAR